MRYIIIFVEYGYEFSLTPCSEADAETLLKKLGDKGITNAYKRETL